MYMDRKEYVKFISKYYKEDIPEKYLNYYYTAKKLYLNGKIKQQSSYYRIVYQLSTEYYYRKAIKDIEKFERPKPIAKEFFITATVERTQQYEGDKKQRIYNAKDKVLYDLRVQAKNEDQAKKKILKRIFDGEYIEQDPEEYYITYTVENVRINSVVNASNMQSMQPSMQFLRAASIVNYEFIPEERKYLKFENTCAEDNILAIYTPLIKKLNQQNFRDLASDYFDTEDYEHQCTQNRGYPRWVIHGTVIIHG